MCSLRKELWKLCKQCWAFAPEERLNIGDAISLISKSASQASQDSAQNSSERTMRAADSVLSHLSVEDVSDTENYNGNTVLPESDPLGILLPSLGHLNLTNYLTGIAPIAIAEGGFCKTYRVRLRRPSASSGGSVNFIVVAIKSLRVNIKTNLLFAKVRLVFIWVIHFPFIHYCFRLLLKNFARGRTSIISI